MCNYRISLFKTQSISPLKFWIWIYGMVYIHNFPNSVKWNKPICQILFLLVSFGLLPVCSWVWLYKHWGHFFIISWLIAKWPKKIFFFMTFLILTLQAHFLPIANQVHYYLVLDRGHIRPIWHVIYVTYKGSFLIIE